MKRILLYFFLWTTLIVQYGFALPRFALMTGAKCGSCHVNPTGGQMRNEYGITVSQDKIPLEALKDSDFVFSSKLSDNISIGGDYRSQFIYDGLSKNTTFQSMTASIYGAVNLSRKFTFFFKQDIVNGTYGGLYGGVFGGTEVFGIAKVLPNGGYIKGGTFLPDYGWRYDDHTAYVRGGDIGFTGAGFRPGLIFVPNYKDIGMEVGINIENLSITSGLFNGSGHTDPISIGIHPDKAYVGKITYSGSASNWNYRLGVSGYGFRSYKMGGVHAGVGINDLVLLGEIDWTHENLDVNVSPEPKVLVGFNSMALLAEADYRAIQGLWLIGRFEMFDPQQGAGDDPAGDPLNSIKRVTAGLEFFPYSFVEIRPQYRFTIETPNTSNDVALVQMHLWF